MKLFKLSKNKSHAVAAGSVESDTHSTVRNSNEVDYTLHSKHATDWEYDLVAARLKQKQTLSRITYVLLIINVALVTALFIMLPLKTVEPYLVTYQLDDSKINIVKVNDQLISNNIALDKMLIRNFTIAHESFNKVYAQENYNLIRAMTNNSVWSSYNNRAKTLIPLIQNISQSGIITIQVKNVIINEKGSAIVKFEKNDSFNNVPNKKYMAFIKYEYNSIEVNDTIESYNPFHFFVTSYSLSEE